MNRSLLFIALALLTWGFGEGMFINFIPIYLEKNFLLTKPEIGYVLGAFALIMAITHIPSGHLADRIGRRPLLTTAWIVGLIATLIMSQATRLPLYLIGLAGYGITAFVSSPLGSYVTAARGQWSVQTALSLTTATFNIGMALGPWVGGQIGDRFGLQTAYLAAAGVFIVSTFFILLIAPQPLDAHDPAAPPQQLWHNRPFLGFAAVIAFATFAMHLAQPLTPNYLEGVRKLSLGETGLIFACGALGNALIALSFSRANPRRGFVLAQALVALFSFSMWRGASLPAFALGYFLLGGFRAARPMFMAQARALVPASQMGLAYGSLETLGALIFIVTPIAAGYLFKPDPTLIYRIAIALIAISMVISHRFSPRKVSHAA